jgi:hypothetical protein
MDNQSSESTSSPLAALVGRWELETILDGKPAFRARATFEWLDGGRDFLISRTEADPAQDGVPREWIENAPFPIVSLIGGDDFSGGYAMLYADGRGVRRIYEMRLDDGVWTLTARPADDFFQRFRACISKDEDAIAGCWERSRDGERWETDFDLMYRRLDSGDV